MQGLVFLEEISHCLKLDKAEIKFVDCTREAAVIDQR